MNPKNQVFWIRIRSPNLPCVRRGTTNFFFWFIFRKKWKKEKKKNSKNRKKSDFEKSIFEHRFLIEFWIQKWLIFDPQFWTHFDPHFGPYFEGPDHRGSMSPSIRGWNQRFQGEGPRSLNFWAKNDPKNGQKWVQKVAKMAIFACKVPYFCSKSGKSRKWPFWGPKSSILGHFGVQNGSKWVILGHFGVQNRRFWVILGSKMRFSVKCHFWRFFLQKKGQFCIFRGPEINFGSDFWRSRIGPETQNWGYTLLNGAFCWF